MYKTPKMSVIILWTSWNKIPIDEQKEIPMGIKINEAQYPNNFRPMIDWLLYLTTDV